MRIKFDINKLVEEYDKAKDIERRAYLIWKDVPARYETREQWLHAMKNLFKPTFEKLGYHINGNIKLSCGFPRGKKVATGQCWSYSQSKGGFTEIFISPTLDDPIEVTDTLLHELCHATVGVIHQHDKTFGKLARDIGLIGKLTATIASPALRIKISEMFDLLGNYPHQILKDLNNIKKQTTRMIKASCPDCGYTVRISQKWIDSAGTPYCPTCNMHLETS